jgi:halimadienyl-diphosphate synthase
METFEELLSKVGDGGSILSTAYDTAWVARLGDIDDELSGLALNWLCEHQLSDGTWGAEFPFCYADRLLSTLAAVISLTASGKKSRRYEIHVQKGVAALEKLTCAGVDTFQLDVTIGIELIAPTLVADAARLGLISGKQESIIHGITEMRDEKLEILAGKKISRDSTAAFSAEMAGQDWLDRLDIDNLQEANGSVGDSPSASAYFASCVKRGDARARAYLSPIVHARRGGAPAVGYADIFESVWVLWNLLLTDLPLIDPEIAHACQAHLDFLERQWTAGVGVANGSNYSVCDSDDTVLAYEVLSKLGRSPDLEAVLQQYEGPDFFRGFPQEVGHCVSANVHVLGALKQAGYGTCHPRVQKVLNFIRSSRLSGQYWRDKWHLSPYYTTGHLVIAASSYDAILCREAVEWILAMQRSDGSWGFFDGRPTAEETAYSIQALVHWQKHSGVCVSTQISRGAAWLSKNCEPPYPPLWVSKTLYCPEAVVKAAIVSAIRLAEVSST